MKRAIHPQTIPGEHQAVRWVTETNLPVGRVTRKTRGKPPQTRQKRQYALFEIIVRNRVFASFLH